MQALSPSVDTAVRLHILTRLRAAQPFSMAGGLLLALAMLWHSPWLNAGLWWGALFGWQCGYRHMLTRLLAGAARGLPLSGWRFHLFTLATVLAGLLWSSAVWWLVPDGNPLYLMVVLLWLAGVSASYAAYLTGVRYLPPLVLGAMLLCVLSRLWWAEVPILRLAGLSVLLFAVVLDTMTWPLHQYLRDSFSAQEEYDRLLGDMSEQQERLDDYNQQLELQGRQLDEALARVDELVAHDPLTGVLSRRAIMLRGEQLVLQASAGQPFCLAMLDLDHFKSINDGFGHLAGDEVLRQTCRLLGSVLRGNDSLGRYGGEEFLLLLDGMTLESAMLRLEQMRCQVQKHDWSGLLGTRGVTLSIGLVAWEEGLDVPQLIRRADELLYAAKRGGRNRVMTGQDTLTTARGEA